MDATKCDQAEHAKSDSHSFVRCACMRVWRLSTTQVRIARHFMAPSYVLAIDQGTTSTRAILFDKDGQARELCYNCYKLL